MKKLVLCLLCCVMLVACSSAPKATITTAYQNLDEAHKEDEAVALLIYDEALVTTPVTAHRRNKGDSVLVLVKEVGSKAKFFRISADGESDYTISEKATFAVDVVSDTVIQFDLNDLGYNEMWYLEVTSPDGRVNGSPIPYPCETDETMLCVGKAWDGKDRFAYGWGEEVEVTEAKPVIYFYPPKECRIDVQLDYAGELTCTYPKYSNGWSITAYPDGMLTDTFGKEYQYLYWEGEGYRNYDFSKGFCVTGEDTAAFLEAALEKMGLNRREANEFIIYWLPRMQNNPYNVIAFQTETYEEAAKLHISPEPDCLIRVFMAWYGANESIEIPAQELSSPTREGFTVVEWGGAEVIK